MTAVRIHLQSLRMKNVSFEMIPDFKFTFVREKFPKKRLFCLYTSFYNDATKQKKLKYVVLPWDNIYTVTDTPSILKV